MPVLPSDPEYVYGLDRRKASAGYRPAELLLVRPVCFSIGAKAGHRQHHRAMPGSVHSSRLVQVATGGRTPKMAGTEGTWCRRCLVPKVPGAEGAEGAEGAMKGITASSSLEIPLIPASSGAVLPRPKRKVLARCRGAVAKQSTTFGATRGQLDNASLCLDNASVDTL